MPAPTTSDSSARVTPDHVATFGRSHRGACVVASGNALQGVASAWAALQRGLPPVEAAVDGARVLEDDPNDMSVGFGGLPNADGVVECDAAVMDATTHCCGGVAALAGIRYASAVALEVMRWGRHTLLVGEGALRFARSRGFEPEDLSTPQSREALRRFQQHGAAEHVGLLSDEDRWDLAAAHDAHGAGPAALGPTKPSSAPTNYPTTTGTVHLSALDGAGRLGCCTSTSGLSWKHPGRVGDSPLIGAGLYCEAGIGSAGGTGRGESALESCAAYEVVRSMGRGVEPDEACLHTLALMARRTCRPELLDRSGRPTFNCTLYALRADGAFGSAAMFSGYWFCVADASGSRRLPARSLFDRPSKSPA